MAKDITADPAGDLLACSWLQFHLKVIQQVFPIQRLQTRRPFYGQKAQTKGRHQEKSLFFIQFIKGGSNPFIKFFVANLV